MRERAIQGLIGGIAGWLPQFIFMMTMYFGFHLTKLRFMDFAGILAFNHKPNGILESIYSEFIVIGQMAVYGILFALVIKILANPNILLKGGIFGGIFWFVTYTLVDLYKTKGIYQVVDFNTSFINLLSSIIWGIAAAWTFRFLNQKFGLRKVQGE